ncbi:unnamed protein product [Gongylonema pulchrum]|uniref:Bestrophin homolog n=1 Tax=Gongylonema pulchrum TaxID=637853 RepID=A0A183D181_9BILA|nr:unnamed protein product [Gongylonema pulchrum]
MHLVLLYCFVPKSKNHDDELSGVIAMLQYYHYYYCLNWLFAPVVDYFSYFLIIVDILLFSLAVHNSDGLNVGQSSTIDIDDK